ncbi:PREDICTED: uncharacterized protein LOC108556575 [Nicrophorus vespilloides]|uniref:Uncharacterized protein LOC108556575 n=1 Tax=Nicrophorus vespilloides TaxID=110193 RepID=A0ABM1M0Y6_NICVS|nr:PREDICTED: uncharacterized protein LOC108556575 [Nicrophorus vespilloides]
MRPDNKSDSFTFHRNSALTSSSNSTDGRIQNCRKKLQDRFEKEETSSCSDERGDRSVLSVLSLNDTRRALRTGADKLSRTFSSVRTSFGTFSQKFKISTKRRQILEEGPMTPNCDTPFSKSVLGRTPTKLYSPFGIESPAANTKDKENITPTVTPKAQIKTITSWQRKRNLLDDIFN